MTTLSDALLALANPLSAFRAGAEWMLSDKLAELAAQAQELERDAERYRWLRENCRAYWSGLDAESEPVQLIHYEPNFSGGALGWQERLDSAIAATLAKDQP